MSFDSVKDVCSDLSVLFRCTALKVILTASFKTEVLRLYHSGSEPSVLDLAYGRRSAQGYLIKLVLTEYDHSAFDTEIDKDLRKRLHKISVIYTKKLSFGRAGISERSEYIEHCPEAKFFPYGAHIFHGCMIFLGKKEAHSDLVQKLYALLGILIDIYAERFETVCRAAQR